MQAHEVLSSWNMKYVSEATQIPEEAQVRQKSQLKLVRSHRDNGVRAGSSTFS